MATHIKNATDAQLKEDFEDKVEPMIDYIREHWNWESMVPKNYAEYLKWTELSHNKLSELMKSQLKEHLDSYKGLDDNDTMGGGFINTLLPYHVAFQQIDQCRDPLTSLVHGLIGWGCAYRDEYEKRFSETSEKKVHQKNCKIEIMAEILKRINKMDIGSEVKVQLGDMITILSDDISYEGINASDMLDLWMRLK